MPDHVIEEIEQTFALHRTQPGLGHDKTHLQANREPHAPSGVGLDQTTQSLLRTVGALVRDIREHVHAVLPRPEDKDLSTLKQHINGDKKSDAPLGRVTLDAAGGPAPSAEVRVRAVEGFQGHVTGIAIRSTDPAFDLKELDVSITLRGTTLNTSTVRFARPFILEPDDEIVLNLTNASAAPVTVEYAVQGWLRREA